MPRETIIRTTVVAPLIRIRVRRMLPIPGEVITGIGQTVNPMQTVARAVQYTRYRILPLSDILKISPEELSTVLQVAEGERVSQGTTLVDKKGFLGRHQQYQSPLDGEVYEVRNGRLIMRQMSEIVELRALVAGRVVDHVDNRGVVLETFGSLIQAAWSTDDEDAGLLKVLTNTPNALFFPEEITKEANSAILVVGWFDQLKVLERARDMGVRGIITGSLPANICRVASLIDLPVFVTNGIGAQGMSAPVFDLLQAADGRRTALLGKKSGVRTDRPQIVIQADKKTTTDPRSAAEPLTEGQTVRLLRQPYLNQVAKVSHLYDLAQTTPAGNKAHGADVQLENGQIVFVPYANMEAII
ncbi:MAG: hypothetical protein KC441_03945 [Anaerolineales bacterium]|nr:hypothetical protein [Anaerolineales bacterium]MCB8987695.1 hypothetical protein [Ardenticatenaceae bacterium]